VKCMPGYGNSSATYLCTDQRNFVPNGSPITCERQRCSAGLPSSPYDTSGCEGKTAGEFCIVGCNQSQGYMIDARVQVHRRREL